MQTTFALSVGAESTSKDYKRTKTKRPADVFGKDYLVLVNYPWKSWFVFLTLVSVLELLRLTCL